jgi:hypothetical protein
MNRQKFPKAEWRKLIMASKVNLYADPSFNNKTRYSVFLSEGSEIAVYKKQIVVHP